MYESYRVVGSQDERNIAAAAQFAAQHHHWHDERKIVAAAAAAAAAAVEAAAAPTAASAAAIAAQHHQEQSCIWQSLLRWDRYTQVLQRYVPALYTQQHRAAVDNQSFSRQETYILVK